MEATETKETKKTIEFKELELVGRRVILNTPMTVGKDTNYVIDTGGGVTCINKTKDTYILVDCLISKIKPLLHNHQEKALRELLLKFLRAGAGSLQYVEGHVIRTQFTVTAVNKQLANNRDIRGFGQCSHYFVGKGCHMKVTVDRWGKKTVVKVKDGVRT